MKCDSDIALWNQRSAEFLSLSPWEQDLYIHATNQGFDFTELLAEGIHLEEALEMLVEGSTILFGC